ncbi:class II fructose-bisphosphate aldolase [Oscillospiraceae bacterium 42-9]|jgi:ketose-bisphosphate aldolase|uniref:class II fructose-bisphosphate aldolase n=1 Tax=Acutalibacter sp. TaxID=1918636 RepID=UPI00216BE2F5|nr:class II fructose-bisphosphate aldolase [Acutalibacter sp.]
MPLAKVKDILTHATENHYGVAAVNVFNYETVKWVAQAAERERVPVIIQLYPGFESYIALEHIAAIAKDLAAQSPVPIAVHLDHSASYEIAVKGIKAGFPSVMVDGSALPYEENLALTAAVTRTAAVFGVDVEAELGHVGSGARLEDITDSGKYTSVAQAQEFVEKTGCGSLAVAVGNAHGEYIQAPSLDFGRIAALRKAAPVPLVLHGCSGIPHDQLRESVRLGMSKFNIATEYFQACCQSVAGAMEAGAKGGLPGLMEEAAQGAVDFVRGKMRLLNPNGFSL